MSSTMAGLVQLGVLLVMLAAVYVPFGTYLARVYTDARHWRVERAVYRLARVDPDAEQRWTGYAAALLAFSFLSVVLLYVVQRLQAVLPLSLGRGAVEPGIAFNTAVSFVTNTNWQSYVPETVMGHLVQMAGLTVQNFVSAAVGMAVAVALVRGFARASSDRIGNFWVDLVRAVTRVLLPISFVAAIVLVALGVTMSLRAGVDVTSVDGRSSTIALAPTAAQEAIKELGTNGGGIFNANSAHPFENPTALTNLLQIFLLLVIPVSLTRAFGVMVRDVQQGGVILAVMGVLWGAAAGRDVVGEPARNGPAAAAAGAALEGKEVRFDIPASVLFAVSTTGTSTGAVNSLHDSCTGLGGGALLLNMLLGEVAPGGVGAGLYGILVLAAIAVFLAGLMVGRTPEYLGKKLGRAEVTARRPRDPGHAQPSCCSAPAPRSAQPAELDAALANSGPHGLSEVLYAYASAGNNNGSAFAGLDGDQPVLPDDPRPGDAVRPVRPDPGCAGPRRLAGRPETRRTRRRHAAHQRTPVRGARRRHRRPRRCPDLLPGPRAGSDRGGAVHERACERINDTVPARSAARAQRGRAMAPRLSTARSSTASTVTPSGPGGPSARVRSRSVSCGPRCRQPCASSTRASSARNPVMFVVCVGSVLVTVLAAVDPSVFSWLIALGCGSPCCSPTWPSPSPRVVARRRPTPCAAPGPRPSRGGWRLARMIWPAPRSTCRAPRCASATGSSSRPAR